MKRVVRGYCWSLVQGHRASERHQWGLNSGGLPPGPILFLTMPFPASSLHLYVDY